MKKTTTKPKKVKKITEIKDTPITGEDIRTAAKTLSEAKPVNKVSGICIFCNDPVTNETGVYNHPCHRECATIQGDRKIRERIKELQNG